MRNRQVSVTSTISLRGILTEYRSVAKSSLWIATGWIIHDLAYFDRSKGNTLPQNQGQTGPGLDQSLVRLDVDKRLVPVSIETKTIENTNIKWASLLNHASKNRSWGRLSFLSIVNLSWLVKKGVLRNLYSVNKCTKRDSNVLFNAISVFKIKSLHLITGTYWKDLWSSH